MIIYVDHNVMSLAADIRSQALDLRAALVQISTNEVRIALSAWHVVEIAQFKGDELRAAYADLVDKLNPIFISNPIFVKRAELSHYIRRSGAHREPDAFDTVGIVFNESVTRMWSSFGGAILLEETFEDSVLYMRDHGAEIMTAVRQTPLAIRVGREARAEGSYDELHAVVDADYLAFHMPPEASEQEIEFILGDKDAAVQGCRTMAVEDAFTHLRVKDGFTPRDSHAADLQHAMSALPYCDAFLTFDKELREHSRQTVKRLGLPCQILDSLDRAI